MRRLVPALAAAMAAGCGYTGDPLPPLANVPAAVTDLSAMQLGNRIIARLTVPTLTTEGHPIKGDVMLDLRFGPLPVVARPTAHRRTRFRDEPKFYPVFREHYRSRLPCVVGQ